MNTSIDMPTPFSAASWAALKNRLAPKSQFARETIRTSADRIEQTRHIIHAVALNQAIKHMVVAESIELGAHTDGLRRIWATAAAVRGNRSCSRVRFGAILRKLVNQVANSSGATPSSGSEDPASSAPTANSCTGPAISIPESANSCDWSPTPKPKVGGMEMTPQRERKYRELNRDAGKRVPGLDTKIDAQIWAMFVPNADKDAVEQTSRELNMSEADVRRMLIQRFFEGEAE
ncbi:hypothetical protein [Kocuria rosea]|uniref:Uncharacterized protein n=1 Tax=Kocuria rosea TaxID=1275 RepID=A0A4R5YGQ7_KOCRO|nr:hypothetical protein [Kocuria rosea]TDL42483.1 hypothetical protein E2R59_11090 [Kocuria rosea]